MWQVEGGVLMRRIFAISMAMLGMSLAGSAAASHYISGQTFAEGNRAATCAPFRCEDDQTQYVLFQQVFSNVPFAMNIAAVSFYSAETGKIIATFDDTSRGRPGGPDPYTTGNIKGDLFYTDKTPDTLSTNPLDNVGTPLRWWRTQAPAVHHTDNTQEGYVYDPARGSLLLQILIPLDLLGPALADDSSSVGSLYLLEGQSSGTTRRGGLVAEFYSVPEPQTWALVIIGFGAAGLFLRRSRASNAVTGLR